MEELVQAIQSVADGKSVHTRNKAVFYLRRWKDTKPEWYGRLKEKCNAALATGEWGPVRDMLARCW